MVLVIPHESILVGTLLYCLHINDLNDYLDITMVLRLLYADDLQIYIQVPGTKSDIQMGVRISCSLTFFLLFHYISQAKKFL